MLADAGEEARVRVGSVVAAEVLDETQRLLG